MVNRGDGGARRPAPPAGRPAPKPAGRPAPADEGEEKTSALNLADIDLDAIDAAPAKKLAPKASAGYDDEDNERTNAINLADIDLDAIDAMPAKAAPPARPQPTARPQPAPAQRPAPSAPPAKAAPPARAAVDEGEEKTSALNLNDIDLDALDALPAKKPQPAPTAAPKTAPAKTPAPAVAPPAAKAAPKVEPPKPVAPAPKAAPKKEEPVVEKTMAVSLEEFESKVSSMGKGKAEPPPADRTFLVDDEDAPALVAPVPKRVPAALQGKAPDPAPAAPAAAHQADPEPKLVVRVGPDQGKAFQLTKDLSLVGRGLDADCVINDASASRRHFNILRTLNGWKLVDLGSGNGTKVDGNRVSEIALKHGMKIEAGGTTLEWVMEEPAAAPKKDEGRPGTLSPGLETGKPSRRAAAEENKPAERKRDASKLDKFGKDDLDELKGAAKGGPPPADEKTSFGDIAALEIDPEWEQRRNKQRKEGVVEAPVAEAVEEVVEKKGGVGKKIAIAGILVGVLGGGFVAADKFAGLGIIFPKEVKVDKPTETDKPAETDKPKDGDKPAETDKPKDGDKPAEADKPKDGDKAKKTAEAQEKVKAADAAAKDKRVLEALAGYKAALALDDLVDGGENGLAAVEKEVKSIGLVLAAIGQQGERKFADANKTLEPIAEGTAYHGYVAELAKASKDDTMVDLFQRATELLMKKDLPGAKAAVEAALKLSGEYAEGAALKDAIERAGAPDADNLESDPTKKGTPVDFKAGLDAYAKGDFQAAINAFDGVQYGETAGKADVGKAKAWSAAATTVDEAMKQAVALAAKPEEAMPYILSARKADAIMGGGQKAKIDVEYAKALGFFAKKALEAKDLFAAALQARVALAIDANHADAKAVLEATGKDGKTFVAEAKTAAKDSPDKAVDLALKALRLLAPADPDAAEAKKLVEELTKL